MAPRPKLVLIVLDGVPPTALTPERMPQLWQLAAVGGNAPHGGRTSLPAMTYPSNATIITGCSPVRHGVRSNDISRLPVDTLSDWAGAAVVQTETLLGACRRAGLRSAVVLGDQALYRVLGCEAADWAWPPAGIPPADVAVDPFGYISDAAVRPRLLDAVADPSFDLVFGHLNETDTSGHLFGPDASQTHACYAAADAILGEVVAALRADWERCVLVVLSDHGMEPLEAKLPLDLWSAPELHGMVADLLPEGGCAWMRPAAGVPAERLALVASSLPGIDRCEVAGSELVLAVAEAGRPFATPVMVPVRGFHGGLNTTATLAAVGGGHPAVAQIATAIRVRPPETREWAPTLSALLGVALPAADGVSLLADARVME